MSPVTPIAAPLLEAEVWREVGRHQAIGDTLERIAPLLAESLPIDRVLVRRIDRNRGQIVTLAVAACHAQSFALPHVARSDVLPKYWEFVEPWVGRGELVTLAPGDGSPLSRALLPADLAGVSLAGPLRSAEGEKGVVLFAAPIGTAFTEAHREFARRLLEPLSTALENDVRTHDMARMREALEADRQALLTKLDRQQIDESIVGATSGLRAVMERVEQVAPTDAPVLLLGETGSGKEVIARAIHARSRRASGPVVRVNCGAIPAELIDSELFGHEKGSFTGAVGTRKGWFERADGGTLFLDEIGELPMAAQVRLLRVLQDGSLERVGGHQPITVDVRIIAATHRDLHAMVQEGTFREDLWYRIGVFPLRLPSLRDRPEDIPALAAHFARRAGVRLGGSALLPTDADIALLRTYDWPGNVRELGAVMERAAILGNGKRLEVALALGASASKSGTGSIRPPAPDGGRIDPASIVTLDQAMTQHIERALAATGGRIEGPSGAAHVLGINPHTLRARMRKLGIRWAKFRTDAA